MLSLRLGDVEGVDAIPHELAGLQAVHVKAALQHRVQDRGHIALVAVPAGQLGDGVHPLPCLHHVLHPCFDQLVCSPSHLDFCGGICTAEFVQDEGM